MLRRLVIALLAACVGTAAPSSVALISTGDQHWELRVNDRPCEIRGVTFSGTGGPSAYDEDCRQLAAIGVNTLRTWGAGPDTRALLDAAHKHGLRVLLGLWFRHGRPGAEADDSFDYTSDTAGIAAQHNAILETVRAYKDHPALLAWGVGNEVFLNLPDAAKPAYAAALEAACREIKKIDPGHPLIAVDAWTKAIPWIEKYCPSVDAHGINTYGPGLAGVPKAVRDAGSTRPWLITEYGSRGDWDTRPDANGVKMEVSDDEKYRTITGAWNKILRPEREAGRCLGLFVFNYSNSTTYTNLKHGLLLGSATRPAWHAVKEIYLGEPPASPLTRISAFRISPDHTAPEGWMLGELSTVCAVADPLDISFVYNFRAAANRRDRDAILPLKSKPGPTPNTWLIQIPRITGALKLYALVKDSRNTLVTATTSVKLPPQPPLHASSPR